jgi:arginase family enzyme
MYANASAIHSAAVSRDDDVGWVISVRKEIPDAGSTAMTHGRSPVAKDRIAGATRSRSDGQDGRHQLSLGGESHMAHGIDAPMNTVQATSCNASPHRDLTESRTAQLAERHGTVLSRCDLGHQQLRSGDFLVHR